MGWDHFPKHATLHIELGIDKPDTHIRHRTMPTKLPMHDSKLMNDKKIEKSHGE